MFHLLIYNYRIYIYIYCFIYLFIYITNFSCELYLVITSSVQCSCSEHHTTECQQAVKLNLYFRWMF